MKAFTVIELLLIIILIGVITGLVLPQLGNLFFNFEFRSSVNELERLMHYAQAQAITHKNIYKITIDTDENIFSLWVKDPDKDKDFAPASGKTGMARYLPDNVIFNRGSAETILFYPDGSTTVGKIIFENKDETTATLLLSGSYNNIMVTYSN